MIYLVLVVLAVGLAVVFAFEKQYRLVQTRQNYKAALAAVSADPDNNAKVTAALAAGRAYARAVRAHSGHKGIGLFDEVALQNDLAARRGNRATPPPPAAPSLLSAPSTSAAAPAGSSSAADRTEQLLKLAGLHEKGLLSKDEFEREKRRLLDS